MKKNIVVKVEFKITENILLCLLQTLGNAGDAIQMFYDNESKDGKGLVPALIRCLKNSALPEKISRAVILVSCTPH